MSVYVNVLTLISWTSLRPGYSFLSWNAVVRQTEFNKMRTRFKFMCYTSEVIAQWVNAVRMLRMLNIMFKWEGVLNVSFSAAVPYVSDPKIILTALAKIGFLLLSIITFYLKYWIIADYPMEVHQITSNLFCPTSNNTLLAFVPHQIKPYFVLSYIKQRPTCLCPTSNNALIVLA